MKVGVFAPLGGNAPISPDDPSFKILEAAESQGFDLGWFGPLDAEGTVRGAFSFAAAAWVATKCVRFQLGVAVPLSSAMHPLRVAEELALLDRAAGGPLEWAALSVSEDADRFGESIAIIEGAVTGEPLSFSGPSFTFPEITVEPGALRRIPRRTLVAEKRGAENVFEVRAGESTRAVLLYRDTRAVPIEDLIASQGRFLDAIAAESSEGRSA
ncbi:MAG: LLM class flavin-dependent oxidoreductase [Myxococcota bacterium]